jgi:anti-anti-sigma regulatory factor
MPVPVYVPPNGVSVENVEEFRTALENLVGRHRSVVIDCSELSYISTAGMRVLENAKRSGRITLVNPTPVVRLLASVFGVDVAGCAGADEPSEQPALTALSVARRDASRRDLESTDAELVSEIRELAAGRQELNGSGLERLTQFERARLARIESRIDDVIRTLRVRRPIRDWLPDGR